MPAKSSTSRPATNGAVRQSPRKRKRDDHELDAIPPSNLVTPKSVEVKSSARKGKSDKTSGAVPNIVKDEVVVDEPVRTLVAEQLKKTKKSTTQHSGEQDQSSKLPAKSATEPTAKRVKVSKIAEENSSEAEEDRGEPKVKRKRKTKEEKEAENMPITARSKGLNMFVGAHVSIAKGVENAVTNAVHIGGNAFALFLQSQRKWENPGLKPENRDAFLHACNQQEYDQKQHVVPHGSYLVNLAAKNTEQAQKSYNFFVNDLKRCEQLKIKYYNFHPGATNKEPLPEAISRIAANLNRALAETTTVVPILENMAGTETIVGSRFSDLAQIIAEVKPEYQSRIGICIDTCHAFAAGYDLRTPEAFKRTFEELDEHVGLKYLKAMHLNDSKGMFKSKKDLHQNIGLGFLGLRAFHNVMNEPRLANIPLILETPCESPDPKDPKKMIEDRGVWPREIKLLESLIGMDPEGDEFKRLEKDLADRGKAERDKMEKWQAEKEKKELDKSNKAQKKLAKAEKGQQSIAGIFGSKATGKKPVKASRASDDEESVISELSVDDKGSDGSY